jgi:preprotein translocase subunit SecB
MSDPLPGPTNGNGSQPVGPPEGMRVQILGQYVKDLSFENPAAPQNLSVRPQIELGFDLQAKRLSADQFEVEMKVRVNARAEDKPVFLLELLYAGVFLIQGAPDEILQPFLLIEAPHLLFPFVRRVVADVIRDGGMPPLMIEPIDFAELYRQNQLNAAQQPQPTATA